MDLLTPNFTVYSSLSLSSSKLYISVYGYCLVKLLLVPFRNSNVLVQIHLVLSHLTLADEHYLLQLTQLEPPILRPRLGLKGQLYLLTIHLSNSLLQNIYKASY